MIGDFALCGERLSAARYTEDKAISVKQLRAVGKNHVFADDILPIKNTLCVSDFLYAERDLNGKGFGNQSTEDIQFLYACGKHCMQSVKLLKLQDCDLADTLPRKFLHGFCLLV